MHKEHEDEQRNGTERADNVDDRILARLAVGVHRPRHPVATNGAATSTAGAAIVRDGAQVEASVDTIRKVRGDATWDARVKLGLLGFDLRR